uniref:Uncharacterized protein n=1 Tax=Anopheles quadriannulatus TaxID=34691 RepID=A0A182XRH9_ANOQN
MQTWATKQKALVTLSTYFQDRIELIVFVSLRKFSKLYFNVDLIANNKKNLRTYVHFFSYEV